MAGQGLLNKCSSPARNARLGARRYAGLDAFIKDRKRAGNVTFSHAMVDDHGDFPRWPLDVGNGSVGGLPMVNFPEVSMWGRSPWGGWGANPLPNRFEGLWQQTEGKVVGGMPYSEGIYEDMNAVIAWQHYWDVGNTANATVREYVQFEFTSVPSLVDDVMVAIAIMEQTWTPPARSSQALTSKALGLLSGVGARLTPQAKSAWRWRLLLLRARADAEMAEKGCGAALCAAIAEIGAIQHTQNSSCCGPAKVECTCGPPRPPPGPGPPAPGAAECPSGAYPRNFTKTWQYVINVTCMLSNVLRIVPCGSGKSLFFFSLFNTGCFCVFIA